MNLNVNSAYNSVVALITKVMNSIATVNAMNYTVKAANCIASQVQR